MWKIIAILGGVVGAGAIVAFALRKRAAASAGGASMPAGMGDPLVSVAVVPVRAISLTGSNVMPGGSRRQVRYSEIARHFSSIRIDGERVIVGKVSRGVPYEGPPIIRKTAVEVWEVGTVGGGSAGMALDALIIVGGAAATAVGGPAAGAGVAAIGAAVRSQVR